MEHSIFFDFNFQLHSNITFTNANLLNLLVNTPFLSSDTRYQPDQHENDPQYNYNPFKANTSIGHICTPKTFTSQREIGWSKHAKRISPSAKPPIEQIGIRLRIRKSNQPLLQRKQYCSLLPYAPVPIYITDLRLPSPHHTHTPLPVSIEMEGTTVETGTTKSVPHSPQLLRHSHSSARWQTLFVPINLRL